MTPRGSKVSVVVVCWNSAAYLPRCLAALEAQTYRDFEVILVDNASTDGDPLAVAEAHPQLRPRVEVLPTNVGFAAATNRGAHLAEGAWLALLNPDAFPDPTWLQELIRAAEILPNSFFASRQIRANRPTLLDGEGDVYYSSGLALRANYNVRLMPAGPPREVFSACAAAAFYPREAYLAIGGLDEDYFAYHEDVDLGFRLRLRGLRCYLVPAASVLHVGAGSTGQRSAFAVYHGHRNLVWTYAKDMPSPWIWLYLPLHLAANAISVLYFVLAGRGPSIVRAKLDALRGLRRALGKRHKIQADRAVPAIEVIRPMNTNVFGPLEGWMSRQRPEADP